MKAPRSRKPARDLGPWQAPALVVAVGVAILAAAYGFSGRPTHPTKPVLAISDVKITVPERYREWKSFAQAYGRLPCQTWRQTLRALAALDPQLTFPSNGQLKLVFDESAAERDKELPEEVKARIKAVLNHVDACPKEGNV